MNTNTTASKIQAVRTALALEDRKIASLRRAIVDKASRRDAMAGGASPATVEELAVIDMKIKSLRADISKASSQGCC